MTKQNIKYYFRKYQIPFGDFSSAVRCLLAKLQVAFQTPKGLLAKLQVAFQTPKGLLAKLQVAFPTPKGLLAKLQVALYCSLIIILLFNH